LITFAAKYTEIVIPVLKAMFDAVTSMYRVSHIFEKNNNKLFLLATTTTDLATAKQKEAYYAAIGRCAHRLKDVIGKLMGNRTREPANWETDFDQWLTQVVVKEVSSKDPL
jgi:hypothetical protein